MSFKGEVGFARMTNLMMNIFIGIVLGVTFLFVTNNVAMTPAATLAISFVQAFVLSVCVGYAMGDIIPTLGLAQRICGALGLKSGLLRHLVTCAVLDVVNVSIILCLCMFINIVKDGGIATAVAVIAQLWPIAMLAGFVGIACTLKAAMAIGSLVSGYRPGEQEATIQ